MSEEVTYENEFLTKTHHGKIRKFSALQSGVPDIDHAWSEIETKISGMSAKEIKSWIKGLVPEYSAQED